MQAIGQSWLLIVAAVAVVVILSGRMSAIAGWFSDTFGKQTAEGELALIVNLVEAAKTITDAEQRKTVRDACMACFVGWLKSKLPEG